MLTERNINILKIIVEEYLETWDVLGSKLLLKKYDLWVSSATVRNDMSKLEELELVYQPYNSAWRLPTTKWLRAFVDFFMQASPNFFLDSEEHTFKNEVNNFYDLANRISKELAKKTGEIAFFMIPENNLIEYSGIWNFLEINHSRLWDSIFSIIKMLEDKYNFIKFSKNFPLKSGINVFIWEENIIDFLKDYTIIIKKINISGKDAYIWLIWSLKMNYSFNISAVNGMI